jgi:hypothetical protein
MGIMTMIRVVVVMMLAVMMMMMMMMMMMVAVSCRPLRRVGEGPDCAA